MSTNRTIVLANGELYHIFNRGIDRQPVFTTRREYERMMTSLWYYRFEHAGASLSYYLNLGDQEKLQFQKILEKKPLAISPLAYCLMPNHFHIVLRQEKSDGVRNFVGNITNSYTKYFNKKRKRVGPLFQGTFKSVYVETSEQFLHLTRYVHLNPVTAYLCKIGDIASYPWSSYGEYLEPSSMKFCRKEVVRSFVSLKDYGTFMSDHLDYEKNRTKIHHLAIDEFD